MRRADGAASRPVDRVDLGRAIAAILRDPAPHAGRSYTITGGQAWSDAELVEFIAQATGKPMRYQPIEAAAAREALAAMGMPSGSSSGSPRSTRWSGTAQARP